MNQQIREHRPPRLPQRFLRWYCKPDLLEDIEGDIHEDYNKRYTRSGKHKARLYYWLDVIRFFRPFAIRNIFKAQIHNNMFKFNTLIAFRNLSKNKLYSFINIAGLAIGIAACLIIAHYVIFQMGYDRFHENADRIYRVHVSTVQNGEDWGASAFTGFALAPALEKDIPEFDAVIRAHPYYGGGVVSKVVDSVNTGSFREESMLFADPDILKMLSFDFVQGDGATALDDPSAIIITESTKTKYFGNSNELVLGEILNVNGGWARGDMKVTGVIKDLPANSHFKFDFLMPMATVLEDEQYQSEDADWGWTNFYTYAMLNPQNTEPQVEEKIADLMHKYQGETLETDGLKQTIGLQQLPEIHLRSEVESDDMTTPGDIKSVYFMIIIAAFILVIAWINFINLSTAKASERGLEVGIKKAIGAQRNQLMGQFLTESFWVNFIAIGLAILITFISMPYLNVIIGEQLEVNLLHPVILASLIGLTLIGPMLAGLYPAVVMSSFKTVTALKGKFISKNSHAFNLRRGLVVFQFIISTLLIVGTFTVSRQLTFMQNEDTGMSLSQILAVKGPEVNVSRAGFEAFKNNMSQYASVEAFSSSRSVPGAGYNWGTEARKSGTQSSSNGRINVTWIDENFLDAFDMELISGRNFEFSQENIQHGLIVNEACLDAFGLGTAEQALNEKMIISSDTVFIRGVVKDHHWNSLHSDYSPAVFMYRWASVDYFSLKVNPQNIEATIDEVESQFNEAFPGNPVEYYFLNEFFNRQYKADLAFANLFKAFALFAILAACMGLFGLASYSVVQKAKEIGVRRVLGASSGQITYLFSRRYLILMLIANVIAIPIAYWGINDWLNDFAFSISITPELFLLPVIILLGIAAITVSFQTLRASRLNPVKNLRSE